jgi:hypothetical protein
MLWLVFYVDFLFQNQISVRRLPVVIPPAMKRNVKKSYP